MIVVLFQNVFFQNPRFPKVHFYSLKQTNMRDFNLSFYLQEHRHHSQHQNHLRIPPFESYDNSHAHYK